MGYRIAVGSEGGAFRDVDLHDDLEDAMDALNKLINQKDWKEPDLVVSLFDTKSGKRMAQYGLQDFNYEQTSPNS